MTREEEKQKNTEEEEKWKRNTREKKEYFQNRKISSIGKNRFHNLVEYQEDFTINKLPSAPKCNFVSAPPPSTNIKMSAGISH